MRPSPSPLELLLPDGFARRALVLGAACPSVLAPSARGTSAEGPVDLVVIAPTRDERRDPAWVRKAASEAAACLAPEGIIYVVPARARRLQQALAGAGLEIAGTLLHIPDIPRSRHVVPVGTAAERYALSGRLDMKGAKRLVASAAMRSSRLAALGPTGTVIRRSQAPLAAWLYAIDGRPRPSGGVLLSNRRAWSRGSVLHRFVDGADEPDAVAKVSVGAAAERRGLHEVAPAAARAGVHVPEVLWSGRLGPAEAIVQSALAGTSAALAVARGRLDPGELVARVAGWLERWSRASARPRLLGPAELDRFVLSPARRLTGGSGAYADHLSKLCARASGSTCPFVATHGDLTAANVLVDADGGLGILDWEEAADEGLPLTDFLYSAADAYAAAGGYRDRVQAFRACFASGGEHGRSVEDQRSRLARMLAVEDVVQELCFHACWLQHAADEHARSSGSCSGPFATIVRVIAEAPGRFGAPRRES